MTQPGDANKVERAGLLTTFVCCSMSKTVRIGCGDSIMANSVQMGDYALQDDAENYTSHLHLHSRSLALVLPKKPRLADRLRTCL